MTIVDKSDLVEILVPRNLVVDVYRLISEKTGSTPPKAQRSGEKVTTEEIISGWDAPSIKRMYKESEKPMRAILDHLAARPGETVTAEDLVNVLAELSPTKKATSIVLGGTLGAFGRRVKSRYKRDSWPFERIWSHEEGQVHYWMSEDVASVLKS